MPVPNEDYLIEQGALIRRLHAWGENNPDRILALCLDLLRSEIINAMPICEWASMREQLTPRLQKLLDAVNTETEEEALACLTEDGKVRNVPRPS